MKLLVIGDFQGVVPAQLKKGVMKEEFDAVVGVGDYAGIHDWRPYVMESLRRAKKGLPRLSPVDFFGDSQFKKLIKKEDTAAKQVLRSLQTFGKPVILVFGNGDNEWYRYPFDTKIHPVKKDKRRFLRKLRRLRDITYGKTSLRGFSFIGLGGYIDIDAYFDRRQFKDDTPEQLHRRKMRREKTRKHFLSLVRAVTTPRIFVFHYPPKGVFDIIRDKRDNPMNGKSAGIGFLTEAIRCYKPILVLCGHMHEYQGMKRIGKTLVVNPGNAEKGKYAVVEISEKGKVKKVRLVR